MARLRKWVTLAPVLALAVACSKDPAAQKATDNTAAPPPATPVAAERAAPPAAPPAAPAAAEGKPRVEGQGFVVEVKSPEGVAPGGEATAQVVLTATGPYHLNKDFPTALTITPPAGVELAKTSYSLEDAAKWEEKSGRFDVKFTAKDGGDKKFAASFRFAVCTETTCDPKTEALGWTVPVKATP